MNRAANAWEDYRLKVYDTLEPLDQMQERECSLAFYAGMIEAFAEMSTITVDAKDEDSEAREMETFRLEIEKAVLRENLNRSRGDS